MYILTWAYVADVHSIFYNACGMDRVKSLGNYTAFLFQWVSSGPISDFGYSLWIWVNMYLKALDSVKYSDFAYTVFCGGVETTYGFVGTAWSGVKEFRRFID